MSRTALLAFALAASGACSRRETGWLDPEPAPPLEGTAVRSEAAFALRGRLGRVVLVSFGYTSCAEICPDTFASAKTVFRELGSESRDVDFVYVTVDPARDDPPHFRKFLGEVDPRFEGVYVPEPRLAPTLARWHVTVRTRLPDTAHWERGAYSMDHTAGFWGVDRRGRLRFHLGHGAADADLVAATRKLLAEGA